MTLSVTNGQYLLLQMNADCFTFTQTLLHFCSLNFFSSHVQSGKSSRHSVTIWVKFGTAVANRLLAMHKLRKIGKEKKRYVQRVGLERPFQMVQEHLESPIFSVFLLLRPAILSIYIFIKRAAKVWQSGTFLTRIVATFLSEQKSRKSYGNEDDDNNKWQLFWQNWQWRGCLHLQILHAFDTSSRIPHPDSGHRVSQSKMAKLLVERGQIQTWISPGGEWKLIQLEGVGDRTPFASLFLCYPTSWSRKSLAQQDLILRLKQWNMSCTYVQYINSLDAPTKNEKWTEDFGSKEGPKRRRASTFWAACSPKGAHLCKEFSRTSLDLLSIDIMRCQPWPETLAITSWSFQSERERG